MKIHSLLALLGGALACSSIVRASSSEEIIVTGTRTPLALDRLAASATIITRADIEKRQVNSLPELLKGVAGLDVTVSGGDGKVTDVRIRGTESDHVLVLVDGVRIGSATVGTTAFQHLPLAQIERIEIVRGPRSSLWGSEALGGVIHIFTRRGAGETPRYSLDAGGGSYETVELSVGISGEYKDFDYSAALSRFDSDGIDARRPVQGPFGFSQPDKDGYDNFSFHVRGGYRLSAAGELEAFILRAAGTTEFDGSFQDKTDFVQQVVGAAVSWRLLERWRTELRLSEACDETENFAPSGAPASAFDTKRQQLSWQNDLSILDAHGLTLGLDYRQDEIQSSNRFAQTSRDNVGIYGQYSGNFHGHQLIASVRWDDDQVFGGKTTGGVGWSYRWREWLRLYASYASAYKTPSFNELFFPGFGNPALGPENADSYEAGLAGQHDVIGWSLRAYRTEVKDLIVTVFDPATADFSPQNVNKAEIVGVEAEFNFQWREWEAALAVEYLDPKDKASGSRLPRRVKQRLSLDLSRALGRFILGGRLLAEGSRFNNAGARNPVSGFATLDLRAEYRLNDNIRFQAKLANLLDKQYETIDSYNSKDRNFFLSVHYQSR